MKKFLISVILAALTAASVMAQDAQAAKPVWDHGDNVSDAHERPLCDRLGKRIQRGRAAAGTGA